MSTKKHLENASFYVLFLCFQNFLRLVFQGRMLLVTNPLQTVREYVLLVNGIQNIGWV